MKNLFEQSRSHWVRYDRYELKTAADGKRYITPTKDAKPDVYNPMKEMPGMVLDALNVGMLMMGRRKDVDVETAILEFVTKYGLLGLMTALPTTPSFMDYEAVYLPKNHFIKAETMETEDYLALFYPFEQLDMVKKGVESDWTVSNDRTMIALTMTFADEPMAKTMSFQREYAEPYDWIAQQLKDWAFTLTTSILYYHDYDSIDEGTRSLYRKAMAALGGIAPSYHIELLEKPTIYWDFHSLLLGIQMMFSFMLVDGDQPLRLCKHCQKVFLGSRSNAAFCSPRCKNQYNVYKSREDMDKFAHLASFEEIVENDYNLNIPRYVDTFEEEKVEPLTEIVAKINQTNATIESQTASLLDMLGQLHGTTPEADAELKKFVQEFKG